jgi:hypothetical protein
MKAGPTVGGHERSHGRKGEMIGRDGGAAPETTAGVIDCQSCAGQS